MLQRTFTNAARLRLLYLTKLAFTLVLIALAIAFGVLLLTGAHQNVAAIIEWLIAFGFTLYLLTFYVDLRETKIGRMEGAGGGASQGGNTTV